MNTYLSTILEHQKSQSHQIYLRVKEKSNEEVGLSRKGLGVLTQSGKRKSQSHKEFKKLGRRKNKILISIVGEHLVNMG